MAFCVPSAFLPPSPVCYTVPWADPHTSGEFVNPSPVLLPVGPISGITITNITTTGFTVSLNSVLYATNYQFRWGAFSTNSASPTSTFSGLPPDTTNSLLITAYNEDGSVQSTPQNVTTALPPPSQPINLSSSSVSWDSFVVNWTPSDYATSYSANWGAFPGTVVGTTANFSNLPPQTPNNVIVSASNATGVTPSAPYPVTTLIPPPTAPVVQISDVTDYTFKATWTSQLYAQSYTALWGSIPGIVTNNSAQFSSLPPLTTSNLVVTASNSSGTASSTPIPVTTSGVPPDKPTGFATTIRGTSYFHAAWTNDPKATSYSVTLNGSPISNSGNSIAPNTLTAGSSNTVVITASNSYGTVSSDPYVVNTLLPKYVSDSGILSTAPYPCAPYNQQVYQLVIPSDYDIGNNPASSNWEFITIAGSTLGTDPNNPTQDYMYLGWVLDKDGSVVNFWNYVSTPGQNLIVISNYNTVTPWDETISPGVKYNLVLRLDDTICLLDTTNIQYSFTYNPFATP